MNIGSLEGLALALLLVVPGGLGIALRRSIFSAQPPTPFTELLQALAASLVALLFTETIFMVVDGSTDGMGNYALRPLLQTGSFADSIDWLAYTVFGVAALVLPSVAAWARRSAFGHAILGRVSPHADGLDFIIHDALRGHSRSEEVWVTVSTMGDEALMGQLAWRSTAPDPLELVITRVRDLNDPTEEGQQPGWFVHLRGDAIRAIWVHVPETEG